MSPGPWGEIIDHDEKIHHISVFVIVNEFTGEPKLQEKDKCEGWIWVHLDEVPEPRLAPLNTFLERVKCKNVTEL
jgi:8-oxo-dGTP diphosphatase